MALGIFSNSPRNGLRVFIFKLTEGDTFCVRVAENLLSFAVGFVIDSFFIVSVFVLFIGVIEEVLPKSVFPFISTFFDCKEDLLFLLLIIGLKFSDRFNPPEILVFPHVGLTHLKHR